MPLHNADEYNNPTLYDKENEAHQADVPFLLKWAAQQQGIIIDLACGTGRATIPLAQHGYELIGVDIHNAMLDEAKKKAENANLSVEWIEQDCSKLQLNMKSHLIYTVGNSFQHFLTNEAQDNLLSSVNHHLEVGGIFIFDTRFPSAEELFQPPTEEYWRSYIDYDSQKKVDVYTISNYDILNQLQHYTTIRKFESSTEKHSTNITLRYVYPKEMERLLEAHGFTIKHIYQDWNETPVTNDAYAMIYVCEKIK
ncbi:class I SAM-dependent methyltransferase [Metasolibacillus meyeri]|uniref:Class I SAM-dependent methyltransferase n=1 Tax=Metasolibacillus meyeri TaxID=1071052 RepID=A0AAW9NQA3_9BACL|nr:class I SAM-dependent methyltransferase [Metasolibacillus meyeri]MEC1178671.1 class I SAM-dependent methyltransferase [Metasolibacillus meyeri]